MKLFLVICFSVALVTIATISAVGVDRVPDWVLPAMVFGVPAIAIVVVLALSASKRRRDQEERERKAILDVQEKVSGDN